MSHEDLAEAIREEKSLNHCKLHPNPVFYDGLVCPACEALTEIPQQTKSQLEYPHCE